MKNIVFVVNKGEMLRPNSRASITAAAVRWQAEFMEVTEWRNPLHPACWKTEAFTIAAERLAERMASPAVSEGEPFAPAVERTRLFILDADVVVSAKCPNPFTTFQEGRLVVVSDRQSYCPARDKAEVDEVEIVTGMRTLYPDYFNSGVILATQDWHEQFFLRAADLCERNRHLCWHDQTPFNVAAQVGQPLAYADREWNYLNPAGSVRNWTEMGTTGIHIYHFAGNPDRKSHIDMVRWE